MTIAHLEVLVEEPSMEGALRELLPRLLGSTTFEVYRHQGKADLLKKLPGKLAAYAKSLPTTHCVLVVVDRDRDDCTDLKTKIDRIATHARLTPRSASNTQWRMVSRIAIEELEAWYFGDWAAVRAAYPRVKASIPRQAEYRRPDEIEGGTCEAFERELQKAGYFATGLRKIEIAREVAKHMEPRRNTSPSFQKLVEVLQQVAS
jgi:Domain of unknown function (DUF4276)